MVKVLMELSMRDAPYEAEAAKRVAMVSDTLRAQVEGRHVMISGAQDEAEARHCWRVWLLNERLVAEASADRQAVLALLVA
ncbi:hypothetical protein C8J42_12019 [Sphingomonas sp. PP-CE-1A-559]|jgi:hypothetical protein|uniref:hypothetical protein n=1 Tax=Sphingomonas sp. PP-CE-1A-559 TaxID=2135657 RepID=UPI001056D1F9|nr:hypothetical protein [Sphingomonas sp. PP-CE-1A-559]TCP82885.1 hypothetical protein C8J42_12019 [Sphingomonas sp. PP-CE-1A-559]